MSWVPKTRNIHAECKLTDIEGKLKGLSALFVNLGGTMSPSNEELQGIGLLIEDIAKELGAITSTCILYEARTDEPRGEDERSSETK